MSPHTWHTPGPTVDVGGGALGANAWGPEGVLAGLLCLGHMGLEGSVLVRAHHSLPQPT